MRFGANKEKDAVDLVEHEPKKSLAFLRKWVQNFTPKHMEIDKGRATLVEVVKVYSKLHLSDANEAETRKKVIDAILEKVLGWNPVGDISYEENVRGEPNDKFADYVIRTATTGLVVEAKRAGKSFELPSNRKAGKVGGFLSDGEVGKAIHQARDYAVNLGLQFAVATNGAAWIVFPAVRTDGIKWEDTEAHIFRSLEDIQDRFVEFWELLSRQRVIEGNLENTFFGRHADLAQKRLISIVHESGFRLGRNSIYEHIEASINAAFTDESLLSDPEGLEFCYVKSSERVKYDSRLKIHLADAKPILERKVARPRRGRDGAVLDEVIEKSFARPAQFLLVLGPVGAGKTTFLYYTQQISAKKTIDGRIVWLYLDFKRATLSDKPRVFIYRELLKAIETDEKFGLGSWDETIKHAYKAFIETAKKGHLSLLYAADQKQFDIEITREISKERESVELYVERILTWVAKKYPIFLVIDNVDQFEEENFQRDIFIEAQAVAKKIGINVIMALRDATYLRHRNTPSFDAFQVDSIYIDPPQTLPVLSRRFTYAKRFLEGKSANITTESGAKFQVENMAEFLDSVSASLLSDRNGFLIEMLSGGDIRRALGLVREFLASGHTSSDRVLWTYAKESKGKDVGPADRRLAFPRHEIFRGCVLGQRKFYREEDSLLPDVFDSKLGSPGKQLLRFHLLYKLTMLAASSDRDGCLVESIRSELYQIGISDADVSLLLKQLLDFRAIRTADGRAIGDKSLILPTRLGAFLVKELGATFAYIELCLLDCTVLDDGQWAKLRDLTVQIEAATGEKQLLLRLQRVRQFMEYLNVIEEKWVVQCKRYQVGSGWDEQVIKVHIFPTLEANLVRVAASAAKTFERRTQARKQA